MLDPVTEPFFRLDIPNLSHRLNVLSFTGTEAINQPFAFELEVVSESSDLNLQSLMYRSAWLSFVDTKTGINGQIHGADQSRRGPHLGHYRLSLGPRLACLAGRSNLRIFQGLSAPQIIARVLKEHGIRADAHRFELNGTYRERMYCAQHHESDLQFVQRLCEEEGIYYHFQHSRRCHMLVFGDSQGGFRRAPTCPFQTEPAQIKSRQSVSERHAVTHFSVSAADGGQDSRRALEQAEGESTSPYLGAGLLLPLSGHPQKEWNHLWLLTEVQHRGYQPQELDELLAAVISADSPYSNHFQATPWEVGFRPSPAAVRPPMLGVQRARVVGPVVDQVHCDSLGRVNVQFDWGRQGEGAQYASCWVPVSSVLVGEGDDESAQPRVGMDVMVSFIHGDPDQPEITAYLQRQDAEYFDRAAGAHPASVSEPAGSDANGVPREDAQILRMRLDQRMFVSEGQKIELSGGITLTFEKDSELLFRVGDSSVHLGHDGLKLSSAQIMFNVDPAPQSAADKLRDEAELRARANELLELLQASHPLILLCRLPSGGSVAHCQRTPCACRAMTLIDGEGAP
jgi:type VI secretion system secreted protein VgrG